MRRSVPAPTAVVGAVRDRLRNPTHLDAGAVSIDTRALAAFRILAGLLIVADVLLRARNFGFYYTEDGAVPRSLARRMTAEHAVSVYHVTTDPVVIAALFVVTGLVGLQLTVGYRTRVATLLGFLLVVSLDHHNPFVTSYADVLFRMLLFWAVFLPLGERWAVDAVHRDREPRARITSLASAAILAQMAYMYVVNGYHKTYSELWLGGEATPLIMGLDDMTFLLGPAMRQAPSLLAVGGLLWFAMLLCAWLLVLLRGRPRMLLAGAFLVAHASFAVTVRIGAFAYVAIAGVLLFLPPVFWDGAAARIRSLPVDRRRLPVSRTDAERAAARLPSLRLGDDVPGARALRQVGRGVGAVVLVVAVVALFVVPALGFTAFAPVDGTHDRIDGTAAALSVDQAPWTVFAPYPRTTDRYYVVAAETADGERLDLYNDRELTFERPYDELQRQYGTYRERFYMNSVRRGGPGNVVAAAYADHLCETWTEERGVAVTHLNLYVVTEDVTLDTLDDPADRERERERFYTHGCGDNDPKLVDVDDLE